MGTRQCRYVRILSTPNINAEAFVRKCMTPLMSCEVLVTRDPHLFLLDGGYERKDGRTSKVFPLEGYRAPLTFHFVVCHFFTADDVATTLETVSEMCRWTTDNRNYLPVEQPIYLCIATYTTPVISLKRRYSYVRHIKVYWLLKQILLSHDLPLELAPPLVLHCILSDCIKKLLFLLSRYRQRLRFRPLLFTEKDTDTALFTTIKTLVDAGHR